MYTAASKLVENGRSLDVEIPLMDLNTEILEITDINYSVNIAVYLCTFLST